MKYTIAPIPQDYLDRVRNRNIDDLGQPVRRQISATGGEPCRDVLRRAKPGEALILASFSPFTVLGPFREYGPIYVLAQSTAAHEDVDRSQLPLVSNSAAAYFAGQFALRAYDREENIVDSALVRAQDGEAQLERFLARADTAFVHARFPSHGCFALRVDRA